MIIERVWQMPNHQTFKIPAIKKLISEELGKNFIEPFPYPFHTDALEYLHCFKNESVSNLAFDPPYSQRQLKEMYHSNGLSFTYPMNSSYWAECKKEISRTTKEGGKVISFGWNTNGIGKKHGFEIMRIVLVAHGSQHNDTIATVEKKC